MTKDRIYEAWRPLASPWSRWVKPVLFSFIGESGARESHPFVREWTVPIATDTAMIADVPGAEGVLLGVALCREGFRPIPVYNASPYGTSGMESESPPSIIDTHPLHAPVVVDLFPTMAALRSAVESLESANLPASAPPVFLLDSNRSGDRTPEPGWFDNRSFVSPADFPSADFFKEYGVNRIVVAQSRFNFRPDLALVLLALQNGGIEIAEQTPWQVWEPRTLIVKPPSRIVQLWYRLKWTLGYRWNPAGHFGGLVPHHSG